MKPNNPKTALPGLLVILVHSCLPEAQLHSCHWVPWDGPYLFFQLGLGACWDFLMPLASQLEPPAVHCGLTPRRKYPEGFYRWALVISHVTTPHSIGLLHSAITPSHTLLFYRHWFKFSCNKQSICLWPQHQEHSLGHILHLNIFHLHRGPRSCTAMHALRICAHPLICHRMFISIL